MFLQVKIYYYFCILYIIVLFVINLYILDKKGLIKYVKYKYQNIQKLYNN